MKTVATTRPSVCVKQPTNVTTVGDESVRSNAANPVRQCSGIEEVADIAVTLVECIACSAQCQLEISLPVMSPKVTVSIDHNSIDTSLKLALNSEQSTEAQPQN